MVNVDLYSAIIAKVSNALMSLGLNIALFCVHLRFDSCD